MRYSDNDSCNEVDKLVYGSKLEQGNLGLFSLYLCFPFYLIEKNNIINKRESNNIIYVHLG